MKLIKFDYDGVEYEMSFKEIHRFLRNKPVYKHLALATLGSRVSRMKTSGYTLRQALGIDVYKAKYTSTRDRGSPRVKSADKHPHAGGKDLLGYNLRRMFNGLTLGKGLCLVEGYCPCMQMKAEY